MTKNKFYFFVIFFIVLIVGILIRFLLSLQKNIFNDEVAYFLIALEESISDIVLINHWIKDHGILYYLFLKPFILVTTYIKFLRLTNLILYIISSLYIFFFFKYFIKEKWALIPVFFIPSTVILFILILLFPLLI